MSHKFKSKRKFFFLVPIAILFGLTFIVMWLWNAILPEIIYVKTISYWQAMGILVLSKILFGGFSKCGNNSYGNRKRQFINKIKNMSPEERMTFKEAWKCRFNNRNKC
jgi:Ca2+/H+ antiporter, TMEM165/GDT1 family